jgi:hypothetical protein
MAGDWIPWSKGFARKPEVLAIARATGLNRREVATSLMELYEWTDSESTDGRIIAHNGPPLSTTDLADLIQGTDTKFWDAVITAGWLKIEPDGISIPNFDHWMGRSAKARLQKTQRQRRWRAPGSSDNDVDATVDAAASTRPSTTEEDRREQKRREQNQTKTQSPPNPPAGGAGKPRSPKRRPARTEDLPPIPPELDNPQFAVAWASWLEFRAAKRKPVTAHAARIIFPNMAKLGTDRAVAAIEHSIANDYQGIYEPQTYRGRHNEASTRESMRA